MPGDEVIGDSLSHSCSVWRWLPHMPRHCANTLRGIVKCRANSTTAAKIAVRQVKPFEVGRERAMLRDTFIDKLQDYYRIAIRSNTNNLDAMPCSVLATFFMFALIHFNQCICRVRRALTIGTRFPVTKLLGKNKFAKKCKISQEVKRVYCINVMNFK
ncbi:hypothetical protein AVEN_272136-1 [Araneus ventricosus]|uniref:Uncharacterized protein n=1 Tax=Araneus ventricosus TaxID=182803 RepID=A0A4Y2VQK2_ARAVE|nr:hypothetical protein AVEN_272136-1 [Araneus ventricosus]